jgi:hypothetical protein
LNSVGGSVGPSLLVLTLVRHVCFKVPSRHW